MAIALYTGLMGCGKSYSAIENVLIPSLKEGRTIVTNVVLVKSVIYEEFPEANIITLPDQIEYSERDKYFNLDFYPAGSLYIIDECGELFPSGEKQNQVSQFVKQFFTKHRHSVGQSGLSSEILLMTQRPEQLASWLRTLVDTQYHHEKLDKHGLKNQFRCDMYNGAHTGNSIPQQYFIKSLTGKYKPEFFKYYKSHTQNKSEFTSGMEEKVDKRGSFMHVYRNAVLGLFAAVFLFYFGYQSMTNLFGSKNEVDIEQHSPENLADLSTSDLIQVKIDQLENLKKDDRLALIREIIPAYEEDPIFTIPESEDYKLVGVIKGPRGFTAFLRSEVTTRTVNAMQFCSFRKSVRDWICVFNGELIAQHTGPIFPDPTDGPDNSIDLPFSE